MVDTALQLLYCAIVPCISFGRLGSDCFISIEHVPEAECFCRFSIVGLF